jgi:hypothetical protein
MGRRPAVSEGLSATHQRIAGIMGVHTTTVSHRAAEDGWQSIDFRHARLRRMQAQIVEMSRRIRAGEELDTRPTPWRGRRRERRGSWRRWPRSSPGPTSRRRPDRAHRRGADQIYRDDRAQARGRAAAGGRQVAALERLVALCERIAVMAREQADKARRLGDAELAATCRRVERRIVELACGEALRLLTEVFDILREEIAEKAPRLHTDWAAAEAG